MKRVLYSIFSVILYMALGFYITCMWTNVVLPQQDSLIVKIILSCLALLTCVFIEITRPINKIIEIEEQPIIWRILKLDNEKDVYLLRDIQSVVKKKLHKSSYNKKIIQATKELCGKNCKCTNIKKQHACSCGMFNEYVEYLITQDTEE